MAWTFGPFEFNAETRDLRKLGLPIKLQPLPAEVLRLLLVSAGNVVTRKDLSQTLWTDNTHVDFETGLNTAIRKLRRALNDEAEFPRYIETLPRLGYRFVAPVRLLEPMPALEPISTTEPISATEPVSAPEALLATETPPSPPRPPAPRFFRPLVGLVLVLALTLLLALLVALRRSPDSTAKPQPSRTEVTLPVGQQFSYMHGRKIAISPDGTTIAYIAKLDGISRLFLRELSKTEPVELPFQPTGALAFSPLGREIAFIDRQAGLVKLRIDDGRSLTYPISPNAAASTVVWDQQDRIWFAQPKQEGSSELSVWCLEKGQVTHRPLDSGIPGTKHLLPNAVDPSGRFLYLTAVMGPVARTLVCIDLRTGTARNLAEQGRSLRVLPTGHAVFERRGKMHAAAIDPSTGAFIGTPVPLTGRVEEAGWGEAQFDVSTNGTMVSVPPVFIGNLEIFWAEHSGRQSPFVIPPSVYEPLDISFDGKKVLVQNSDSDGLWSVYSVDLTTGHAAPVAERLRRFLGAVWSPDAKQVAISADPGYLSTINIFLVDIDKPNDLRQITFDSKFENVVQQWSASTNLLVYDVGIDPISVIDLWAIAPKPGSKPFPLAVGPLSDTHGAISPDGKWLAYTAGDSIAVRRFPPGPDGPIRIAKGVAPYWTKSGEELVFQKDDAFFSISMKNGIAKEPVELFRAKFSTAAGWKRLYAYYPDAHRFLLYRFVGNPTDGRRFELTTNWFQEVNAQVPLGTR
jgi:DNA-binding winged helix-turn-helix (wHTH) protein